MTTLYAIIDADNKAINFVEFEDDVEHIAPDNTTLAPLVQGANYNYGWIWDGSKLISPTTPVTVPEMLTRKQVRLLLLNQNLLDKTEAMIATQDKATQIEWQDSLEFHRDNPLLNQLGTNLGLSKDQIDQFFIEAAKI